MNLRYEDYGFYQLNLDYVHYLYLHDNQVFYQNVEDYAKKPYLGLIINMGDYTYCIPLTSAKQKHLNWNNISNHHYIIHEEVPLSRIRPNDVYKVIDEENGICKRLLSVLEIGKMIPVSQTDISKIIFENIDDRAYRLLLEAEYNFLHQYKRDILQKAEKLYNKQKTTSNVQMCHVTFDAVERAYHQYYNH